MFSRSDADEKRFERVEVDLTDCLGVAGIDAEHLAKRLEKHVDASLNVVSSEGQLFLETGPAEAVGAFSRGAFADDVEPALAREVAPDAPEASIVTQFETPSGAHRIYQQLLEGHRVIGGTYVVHIGDHKDVALTGSPVGDLADRHLNPRPDRSQPEIEEAMRAHLDLSSNMTLDVEQVVFPVDGRAIWAYLGSGVVIEPQVADLRIVVSGEDLRLLLSHDASEAVWGEALAFRTNPGRDSVPSRIRLDDLDESGSLSGSSLDVEPVTGTRMNNPQRCWKGDPLSAGYDEVSAYYHLNRTAAWVASTIGESVFSNPMFEPLRVYTSDRATRDWVARFIPSKAEIRFGDNDRSGARSADICAHEFIHAVIWAMRQIGDVASNGARGLNEGYADYCQGSMLDDPRLGDWVAPEEARDCSRDGIRFPVDIEGAGVYDIGSAWAATLWRLRTKLGDEVTDLLALDSISYVDQKSSVNAGLMALLASDRKLFPETAGVGRHETEINEVYASTGGPQ